MARIIYGVAGQGFGHSARSHEVISHLIKQGHKVLVLTYGQALAIMKKDFDIIEIPGLGLHYDENILKYGTTVYENAYKIFSGGKKWTKLFKKTKEFKPQIVITDFEPISAGLAHLQRLPLISFNNQHQMTNTEIKIPTKYKKDLLAAKVITKSFVWGAKAYLITSFFKTKITKKQTFLFPPVVRERVRKMKPLDKNFILVYQTDSFDYIIPELEKMTKYNFKIFSKRPKYLKEKNIEYFPHDPEKFLHALKDCRALIATAGLSLISEALWLNKPYFALPIDHQVEQVINGIYLKRLKLGDYSMKFKASQGEKFLKNLKTYKTNLKKIKKEPPYKLLAKFDELINEIEEKKK